MADVAHYLPKPVRAGVAGRALCGVMHTPHVVPPLPGTPICPGCVDAYVRIPVLQTWISNNTHPRKKPEFAMSV